MPAVSRSLALATSTVALAGLLVASGPGSAAEPLTPVNPSAEQLVQNVTGTAVTTHLQALQQIADAHGGNRAAGTPGYDASVEYVAEKLRAAGYDVTTPEFSFGSFSVQAARLTVAGAEVPVTAVTFSPSTPPGGVTAPLAVLAQDATSGCEATDFAGVK
ncbi:MAG: amidohydrolase, partial [Actinomycetota bacterium]|nr:amidohydrolase [Actinomycetota bacterium]